MGKFELLPSLTSDTALPAFLNGFLEPFDANRLAALAALLRQFDDLAMQSASPQFVTLSHDGVRISGSLLVRAASETSPALVIDEDGHVLAEVTVSGPSAQVTFPQGGQTIELSISTSSGVLDVAARMAGVFDLFAAYQGGQIESSDLYDQLGQVGVTSLETATVATLAPQSAQTPAPSAAQGMAITGNGSDETLTGGDDDDTIDGRAGHDTIRGGLGDDMLIGGGGSDTVFGEQGNDTIEGGFGNDVLFGGSHDDIIRGGDGNDQLFGNSGIDQLDGGNNSDTYFVDQYDTVTDTGTQGYDKASIQSTTGISLDLTGWSGVERVNGNDGDDTIDASSQTTGILLSGGDGDDTLIGGSAADLLIGGAGDDILSGGDGDDLLLGSTGNDSYSGGAGNDILMIGEDGDSVTDGGTGNDRAIVYNAAGVSVTVGTWMSVERITGYLGDDTFDGTGGTERLVMAGREGDDTLIGGTIGDTLYGGVGNDILQGNEGDDALVGGDGDDFISGGDGDDLLLGSAGDDTFDGGAGNDVIVISDDGDMVTDGGAGNDKAVVNNAAGVSISVGSWRSVERITGFTGDDTIDATGGNIRFTIVGGEGNDTLIGGNRGDTLYAGIGDDIIDGGADNDVLVGSAGDDTITGGIGNDFLLGGSGSNTYRFEDDFDKDVIVGFQDGLDLIDFSSHSTINTLADLDIRQSGAHTVIRATGDFLNQITLANFTATNLSAADFNFGIQPGGPAQLTLALGDDTGTSDTDRNSASADLAATVTSTATITEVLVSLDGGAFVSTSLLPDGSGNLSLTTAQLETALGVSLPDGLHTVHIAVRDSDGAETISQPLDFIYDTSTPTPTAMLAPSSDTDPVGDDTTSLAKVKLVGTGEAGATVSDGTVSTIVKSDGTFALSGVDVAKGANTITLTTTDAAGNTSNVAITVTGVDPVPSDTPVLTWNQIALDSIVDNAAGATTASRVLAMQSVAVYDVIAALDGSSAVMADVDAPEGASLAAAVAVASYEVLKYAFPAFTPELDAFLANSLATIADGQAKTDGMTLGEDVADRVILIRSQDGWDDFEPYPGSTVPGEWRETGPFYLTAITPEYATMDAWSLQSNDQFRPAGPPSLSSQEYADAVAEVADIGGRDSTTRTADQSQAARFWLDGRGTETTPGHWNSIATDFLATQGLGAAENARVMAVLNIAVADSMIAAWDTKYAEGFWRPEDAIREADSDGNPATVQDPDWDPFLFAPAHPEYVSGHGAASGAAAEVLTNLFGTQTFTTESLGLAGVQRSFDSYWEAAQENADSRLWGGVHYGFSNQDGLELGKDVAEWALQSFNSAVDSAPPTIVVGDFPEFVSDLPVDLTGAALDALSGLASFTVSVNGADPLDVATDPDGNFAYTLQGLADGQYDLSFVATDAAGNQSAALDHTVFVDSLAPTVSLTSTDSNGDLVGIGARLTGTIDGTGTPIIALAYQIGSNAIQPLSFDQETGAFDSALNLSGVAAGDHVVTLIGVDAAGNSVSQDIDLTLATAIPFVVTQRLPGEDATDVGATFRPEVHFSRPVDPTTLTTSSFFLTDSQGNVLTAQVKLSEDGLKAWLFPDAAMPGASTITINLDGDVIQALDGTFLDGDGDDVAGGDFASGFTTVSTAAVANTTITGYLVDPGDDLKPMTVDDYNSGPDQTDYTADDIFKNPIEGATVFILGLEQHTVLTDENGYFELTNVPSGNVKIALDGRTATNSPTGVFWPEMVIDLNVIAGQENTIMASQGTTEEREAVAGRGEVYLPRVPSEILTDISDTEETEIGVPVSAAQDLTAEQRDAIQLVVQPGTAVDENGDPVTGAQVGISTVPPELVMDMLPAGIMQHTFDLTIQAPDAAVFTTPAELTLPNVFNAPPGTKLNLLSFDHTTGRLVIEGTGTVSADGKTVTTDPGTGITKPGWHGMTPPGGNGCNGGDPLQPDEEDPNVPDPTDATSTHIMPLYSHDGEGGIRLTREWSAPDPLDETPPNTGGEDCPEAADDVNGKEQPWLNVKIEIEGPLANFADQEGNLGLSNTEFTLRAGTNAERGFAFSFKSFEDMFGMGGLKNVEMNQLYGSKITITERAQDENGNQTVTKEEIFVTRYVDATDDKHTDGTTEFSDAVVNGVSREVPLQIMGAAGLSVSVASATHFQATNSKLTFDPGATGDQTTDLRFSYAGGHQVAESITLKGKGAVVQKYLVDTTSLETALKNIADGTDPNITNTYTTAAERRLVDNLDPAPPVGPPAPNTERADIASSVKTKTEAFFSAYSAGLAPGSAGDANLMTLSFLSTADDGLLGTSSPAGGIDKAADIGAVVTDRAKWSQAEQNFRLDKAINQSFTGTVETYVNTPFEYRNITSAASLENTLAKTAAHELGHTLGLRHTGNSSGTKVVNVGGVAGSTDFMQQGIDLNGTLSVTSLTDGAIKLAANVGYTAADAQAALSYYVAHYALGAFDLVHETNDAIIAEASDLGGEFQCGCGGNHIYSHEQMISVNLAEDAVQGFDDPESAAAPIEGVGVAVFDVATGLLVDNDLDFGNLISDGAGGSQATRSIQIISLGSEDLELDGVSSTSGAVTVNGLTAPLVLGLGESVVLDIVFDPTEAGDVEASVIFESNASEQLPSIGVVGSAIAPDAQIRVTTDTSNLGGVDRGTTVTDTDMFTITNDGQQDLVVDGIVLDQTAAAFGLVGVPVDLDVNPITLATGETFSFGVSFTGVAPGLSRGGITISSNDTATPSVEVAAMATSYEGMHYFDWGEDYIAVEVAGDILRTVSDEDGNFEIFLPALENYKITVFDPDSGLVAIGYGTTSVSGFGTDLTSGLVFRPSEAEDKDYDGLSADIEKAIGTSDINPDSNSDGISDLNALLSGIEALDPFSSTLGVVRTLELDGAVKAMFAARDQNADGSATDPLLVLTANGLSVIDVTDPRAPVVSSVTPIANVSTGAFDMVLNRMLVVGTNGDVTAWDITDLAAPVDLGVLTTGASHVVAREGQAVVTDGGSLRLFDLTTGDEIDGVSLGSSVSSVRGITQDGGFIYAIDNRGDLQVVEVLGESLILRGSVDLNLSSGARKPFVGDGVVHVPASNGFQGGYITVDVSDPDSPSVISGVDDNTLAGNAIALNGAGRGLLVGDPGGVFGADAIDVVNTSDTSDTGNLITRYQIDSTPTDVIIAAGIGYVGADDGDLHVVNFQPFDTSGVAPQVTLVQADIDVDPVTAGVQILEGSLISLNAMITDDAGLRSVALLVDGDPIVVDLSYPFDLNARIPLLGSGEASRPITLQVRATDTGGNIGLSTLIDAEIVPDTIPPALVDSTLEDGALYGRSKRAFSFTFDEPLDPSIDITSAFVLTGPSGVVAPETAILRSGDRTVALTYPELEQGSYSMVLVGGTISDVAGNATSATDRTLAFELGTFSNEWTGAAGNNLWSDEGNWLTGVVPGVDDDVFVGDLTGEVLLTSLGTVQVKSLVAEAPLRIGFNTTLVTEFDIQAEEIRTESFSARLEVGTEARIEVLRMEGGTIQGDGTVNVTERLEMVEGTFGKGGLLTIENGALAEFGQIFDLEESPPYQRTLSFHRDVMLEGNGSVGAGILYLGLSEYNSGLSQWETIGGKFTVASGSELELTNYNADVALGSSYGGAGIENLGTLRKTGGGTSTAVPFNESLGNVVIEDGFIALPDSATLRLSSQDDLDLFDGLKIVGGTLILEDDVTLDNFQMEYGRVEGDGTLTLTGESLVTGGTFTGTGGIVVPDGAMLQFGHDYDPEGFASVGSVYLYRDVTVEGDVNHINAQLYMGERVYNNTTFQYEYTDTLISVESTGVYTFASPFAEMYMNYPAQNPATGLSNAGGIVKTGGGTSGAIFFGTQTGTFDFQDGVLQISDGTFVLTQELVDAGFDKLWIAGGTVTLDEDVTLTELRLDGGELAGSGSATVQDMTWNGGTLSLQGGVTIPDGAEARVGHIYNFYENAVLATTLNVDGQISFDDKEALYLGRSVSNGGSTVSTAGEIALGATGVAEFLNSADLYDNINNGTLSGISGTGTIRKSGAGTSNLLLQSFGGTIEDPASKFEFNSGFSTITKATVDGGLSHLRITGGTVLIDEDVTIQNLYQSGGRLDGSGDINVGQHFDWIGGSSNGSGTLVIEDTATVQFGEPIEESSILRYLYLGRDMKVEGDATFGSATLYLGNRFYDNGTAGYLTYAGNLEISAGGTMDFRNINGAVHIYSNSYFASGDPVGIVNLGDITATHGSQTTRLAMARNEGTFTAPEGRFELDAGVFEISALTNDDILQFVAIDGATVDVLEDASITSLDFVDGTLTGPGNLNVTSMLNWLSGSWTGTGSVQVADGATAMIGQGTGGNATLYLQRDLEVAGTASLEGGTLRLGNYYYDSGQGQNIDQPGKLIIDPTGTVYLVGDNSDVNIYRTSGPAATSGNELRNNGTLIKSGDGVSSISGGVQVTGTGVYQTQDGFIEIGSGTTLVIDSSVSLSNIRINGGTLDVQTDANVAELEFLSGEILGAGNLTVTTSFTQTGGTLSGSGELIIGASAAGKFGTDFDGSANPVRAQLYVERDLRIQGTAEIEQANLRLGINGAPDTGVDVIIDAGGVLTFDGSRAEMEDYQSSAGLENRLINNGSIVKTGGGIADIDPGILYSGTGTVTAQEGQITTPAGDFGTYTPPAGTPIYADTVGNSTTRVLTAADGVTEISVTGGVLQINEDVTLTNLSMTGGRIEGTGVITVTGRFDWEGGDIREGGELIIAAAGMAVIGEATDIEAPVSHGNLYLGRTLTVNGSAVQEQAHLLLGSLQSGPDAHGILHVTATGSYEARGYNSDISLYRNGSGGLLSEVIVDGTYTKTGGGETRISSVQVSGDGTLTQTNGTLRLQYATTMLDEPGSTLVGDVVVFGGRLVIDGDTDLSGLTGLRVENATLEISGDVSLANLDVINSTVIVTGTTTVTGTYFAADVVLRGGGEVIIDSGASAEFGTSRSYAETNTLGATFTVNGDLLIEDSYVALGYSYYDSGLAQNVVTGGRINVGATGSMTLRGDDANVYNSTNETGFTNEVVVDGTLTKDGGGNSSLHNLSLGAGAVVQLVDGQIELQGGVLTLTQAMVNAGLTFIRVAGGELEISEDVTMDGLEVTSGSISGTGNLTVTDQFSLSGFGSISGGDLIIASTATAQIESGYFNSLGRNMTVDGELEVSDFLYLGSRVFNSTTSQYDYFGGMLDVSAGGVLRVSGDGAIQLSTTPPAGTDWGITSAGTIISEVPQLQLVLLNGGFGTMQLNGGTYVHNSGDLVLTQAMVDAGLTSIRVTNGNLIVNEDVSLDKLELAGGTLDGTGTLTITGDFDWTGGTMTGAGVTRLASTADVQFGRDYLETNSTSSANLHREIEVEGQADFGNMYLYLGQRGAYDNGTDTYAFDHGLLTILDTGVLTIGGSRNSISRNYTGYDEDDSGVVNNGQIIKTGGGTTTISLNANTGTFDFRDGILSLSEGEVAFTQALIDAGFTEIVVQSGTFTVAEALTVQNLVVNGGVLDVQQGITVTQFFDWQGGTIETGSETFTIASTATATIGEAFDPENPTQSRNMFLRGDMDVAGTVDFGRVQMTLGQSSYNFGTGQYDLKPGTFDILATGQVTMDGPRADFFTNTFANANGTGGTVAGVNVAGTLTKINGGLSELPLYGVNTGTFNQVAGHFGLTPSRTDGDQTEIVLTPEMVTNGLDDVLVKRGVLYVDQDLTLEALNLTELSVLAGSGDVTITDSFQLNNSALFGDGTLILDTGSVSLIGEETVDDQYQSPDDVLIAQNVEVRGNARIEQADVLLGGSVEDNAVFLFDTDALQFVTDYDTPKVGNVLVTASGVLEFFGPQSDVEPGTDAPAVAGNGLVNNGTLVKSGSGETTIDASLGFTSNGAIQVLGGSFDAPGTEFDFGL